jgi:two-component system, NarL family, nitrate/nitrite response regulator NarL
MNETNLSRVVVVCDTQPLAIEGIRSLISQNEGLSFAGGITSLLGGMELVRTLTPDIMLLDRSFGDLGVAEVLCYLRSNPAVNVVVWGHGIGEPDALRMLQAGARGVLRKTASPATVIACMRAVAEGQTWMEEQIFGEDPRTVAGRSPLTNREQQVLELIEKGFRNREIASTLGIQTGTVKIHLKHIFEKTGIRGRYGLALTGLREKGMLGELRQ